MNKNSNTYIVIYATAMVVVVATLLAVAAMALKSRQEANMLNEKKEAILQSLSAVDRDYDAFVEAYAVDAEGAKIASVTPDAALQLLFNLKDAFAAGTYPVFEAEDGRIVLPVTGSGLWGPIWGYVALDADGSTVYGAYFAHQGETPGLGAEIEKPAFSGQFEGKQMFKNDRFLPVTVVKAGQKPLGDEDYVDAVSGGTITSKGVAAMLTDCLMPYKNFLETLRTR